MGAAKFGRIQDREKYFSAQLFQNIPQDGKRELHTLHKVSSQMKKHFVLSFAGIDSLDDELVQLVQNLHADLEKEQKRLHLVYCNEKVRALLMKGGFKLYFFQSMLDALKGIPATVEDSTFITAFVRSTIKTLKVQAKLQCKRKGIQVDFERKGTIPGDVGGLIWVEANDPLKEYAIILSFPRTTFLKVMEKFLGEPASELTDELLDGATEITNIIYGVSKAVLNKKGKTYRPSIPILVRSNDLLKDANPKLVPLRKKLALTKCVEVEMESDCGPFFITTAFHPEFNSKELRNID